MTYLRNMDMRHEWHTEYEYVYETWVTYQIWNINIRHGRTWIVWRNFTKSVRPVYYKIARKAHHGEEEQDAVAEENLKRIVLHIGNTRVISRKAFVNFPKNLVRKFQLTSNIYGRVCRRRLVIKKIIINDAIQWEESFPAAFMYQLLQMSPTVATTAQDNVRPWGKK